MFRRLNPRSSSTFTFLKGPSSRCRCRCNLLQQLDLKPITGAGPGFASQNCSYSYSTDARTWTPKASTVTSVSRSSVNINCPQLFVFPGAIAIINRINCFYSTDAAGTTESESSAPPAPNPPTLNLSPSCITQLHKITDTTTPYLRVTVEGGGCSGFQYLFALESSVHPEEDQIFVQDGAKVVIDKVSLDYLNGSTVDYEEELIRSSFRIIGNPNAEAGCSCGASFNIKI